MDTRADCFFIGVSMKTVRGTIKSLLILLTGIILIYAVSVLPFYAIISHDLETQTSGVPYAYIAARLLRFMLCLALALLIRVKAGATGGGEARLVCLYILFALLAVTLLYISGLGEKLYMTVSSTVGIYDRGRVPLALAVLWEQVVSVDLLYSFLLGSLVTVKLRKVS